MKKTSTTKKTAQGPSVRLAVDNTATSAREAGLRWRGQQALANLRIARSKLTRTMRDEGVNLDDENYEILMMAYGEVLDALSATEESIEATYAPAEHFRVESEEKAVAAAKVASAMKAVAR
jgi:hypothetical protein